jgi:hypothetical protein
MCVFFNNLISFISTINTFDIVTKAIKYSAYALLSIKNNITLPTVELKLSEIDKNYVNFSRIFILNKPL